MFEKVIRDIAENAKEKNPPAPEDYTGEDGLLYCGKCRTKKQSRVDFGFEVMVVPTMCRCAEEKFREEQRREEEKRRAAIVRMRLRDCFSSSAQSGCCFALSQGADKKAELVARRYAERFGEVQRTGQGLVLYGETGTGKTFLASCICREVIERGYPAKFTDLREISRMLSSYTKSESEDARDVIDNCDLVVFDDLGAERRTKYMDQTVFDVIDRRCRSGKPFIITTNMKPEEMKVASDVDRRLYSRLMGSCIFVEVTGEDRRRVTYKQRKEELREILGV